MGLLLTMDFKASTLTLGRFLDSSLTGIMTIGLLVMSVFLLSSLLEPLLDSIKFDPRLWSMSLAVNQRLGDTFVLLILPSEVV